MRQQILTAAVWGVALLGAIAHVSAQDPPPAEILRRAIDAAGGQRVLGRLRAPMMWMERGTYYGMGDGVPFVGQYSAKWPNWFRQQVENAFAIAATTAAFFRRSQPAGWLMMPYLAWVTFAAMLNFAIMRLNA